MGSLVFAGRTEATQKDSGERFLQTAAPQPSGDLGRFPLRAPPGLAEQFRVKGVVSRGGSAPLMPPGPCEWWVEEHNRILEFVDGKLTLTENTKPYGFCDVHAPVWFQWFNDDGVEHEYLMTQGYLWTGQYKEAQGIIDNGNN